MKGWKILWLGPLFFVVGCQSTPYGHVQVGPGYPRGNCDEIRQVIGSADSRKGARQQAIEDLKYKTAQIEGNYVRLIAVTAHGSAARGIAYRCH